MCGTKCVNMLKNVFQNDGFAVVTSWSDDSVL